MVEIEEDMRASFYHHLRTFIDKTKDLQILLSHNIQFEKKTIKPDVLIFRKNTYLIGIELKLDGISPYTLIKGKSDINRIKSWNNKISKGYFFHIDNTQKKYIYKKQDWMNNYYREVYYIDNIDESYIFEVNKNVMTKKLL